METRNYFENIDLNNFSAVIDQYCFHSLYGNGYVRKLKIDTKEEAKAFAEMSNKAINGRDGFHEVDGGKPFMLKNFLKQMETDEQNEGYLLVSPSNLVRLYYGLEDFKFSYRPNAPKLPDQIEKALKKAGKTDELNLMKNSDLKSFWGSVFAQLASIRQPFWIDTENFEIPDDVDSWAFANSCNVSGGVGFNTHNYLSHNGFEFLKGYDEDVDPFWRAYFYREGKDIVHAGCYFDADNHIWDNNFNHTSYELTTLLLSLVFDKRVEEFDTVSGFEGLHDSLGIWANTHEHSGYSKWGTEDLLVDKSMEIPSHMEDGYVYCNDTERYVDEDYAVWCQDVAEFREDEYYTCEFCQYSHGVRHFTDENLNEFCSLDCALNYYGIQEV